jgi:surfeit locus 1 family protein
MNALGRRRFRPRFWPSLTTALALAVLVAMGNWQLERLEWKRGLSAEMTQRMAGPAIALPPPPVDAAALRYRPIRLVGRFHHDRELYLEARSHKGRAGLHLVTPFELDDGRVVLVDRGWVPPERRRPETRPEGQIEGQIGGQIGAQIEGQAAGRVRVTGTIRTGGWNGYEFLRPENDPAGNAWVWMDLPRMAARVALEGTGLGGTERGYYLVAGAAPNPGGLPIGRGPGTQQPNNHLGYALTWYALALVLLVIYLLHQSRPEPEPEPEIGEEAP